MALRLVVPRLTAPQPSRSICLQSDPTEISPHSENSCPCSFEMAVYEREAVQPRKSRGRVVNGEVMPADVSHDR